MLIDWNDPTSIDAAKLYCGGNDKLRVGITSGTFDSFHAYHLDFLVRCRRLCDVFIVGVDSDRFVKETKGPDRPIVNEFHRVQIINALRCVDMCFLMDSLHDFEKACNQFIRKKEYGLVFKNQVWEGSEDEVVIGDSKARVVIVPDIEELTSTTELIAKVQGKK